MRKTKEEALITKDQLMDSAMRLFLKFGYSDVSLHKIAGAAGVTRGAFYWHFKTKEDILHAICEREREFIEGLMIELFMIEDLNPGDHLEVILTQVIKNYFDNKRYRDFVELTWFKMEHQPDDKVNHLKKIANELFVEGCQKILTKGIKEGYFSNSSPARTWAIHFTVAINGIYRLYFISPEYMTKKTALAIANQLLASIKNT